MEQKRQQAALIIPALNEAPVIARTLATVPPGLLALVIVADTGSTDDTAGEARRAGATVVRVPERGYGAACLAAIAALPEEIDAVVFMKADASEDPAEASALLAPLYDGRADLVLGSRVLGNAAPGALLPHQRFGNWLATTLIRLLYGHRYTDLGPFRAIGAATLRRLNMQDRNYGWTVEMQIKALRRGLRVLELPVPYGVRAAGENKVSGHLRASIRAGIKILSVVARSAFSPLH
ncbi:MAG: glycosyltransferase [Bryobacterales bacterium]|nr:glycosyltransferase [Bryobacterales bacterium]